MESCRGFPEHRPPRLPAVPAVPSMLQRKVQGCPRAPGKQRGLEGGAHSSCCQAKPMAQISSLPALCLCPLCNGWIQWFGSTVSSWGAGEGKEHENSADASQGPEVPCMGALHKSCYRKLFFSLCIYIYIFSFFFFSLRIGYLKPHGPFHTPPPTQASGRGGSDKIDPIIHCSFAILLLALGRKKKIKPNNHLTQNSSEGRQHAQPCPGWA